MESLISKVFLYQWQRKLVAVLTATVIWFFVNHSITATKTVSSVPIRVINLPADKTIQGLLPNGFLSRRISLTLSGTKDVIDQLEPGDLEIILDVSNQPNEGIVQITKKNVVSLNPNFNLPKHLTFVSYPEFILKMSPLLTEKIPIIIHPPSGDPPKGYEFLDIWPVTLTQTVSGPQDQVLSLKNQGLELTFNLNEITKEQLDALRGNSTYDDEVSFYVPDQWKKVVTPFSKNTLEAINDPEAKDLHINFLRQQLIPIKNELPIHIFYPLKYSATLNPETYKLVPSSFVQFKNNIPVLTLPVFANNVSKLFLEIVQDNIEIDIVTVPQMEREKLKWSIGFIDETHLEDIYVAFLLGQSKGSSEYLERKKREREKYLRQRFRSYMQNFSLYLSPQYTLKLESRLEDGQIRVHVRNVLPSNNRAENANAR
jgi:hypothetical protein